MKHWIFIVLVLMGMETQALEWRQGRTIRITCDTAAVEPVVRTVMRMFGENCMRVLGSQVTLDEDGDIVMNIDAGRLKGRWEAYRLETRGERLYVTGSDSHGLAYGLLEVSRLMGVSPWEWWADVTPQKLERFTLPKGYKEEQAPDVQFRGIFINDEDWGMLPWATKTHEPTGVEGRIGPKTHSRIFELLLRLRANAFWPAMHECSEPFFLCEENREMALRYGIYIGTSHCEPMACNVNGEWRRRGQGDYDYVSNSESVRQFWEQRVSDVAHQPIIYTLGMRGVHDGAMQGAKTVDEQRHVLERVIEDQREMIGKYVDEERERVPQVFIPYKEVLDVYNSGLEVPDDVCLMWCDDNYGYIRHFPTEEERNREGGNGIYYHVSYWGRPHDYLWLGTFSPALLKEQMSLAYDKGIRRMWILNVGDLKPAEYQTQLFLDMAWDMDKVRRQGVEGHLNEFLTSQFPTVTRDAEGRSALVPCFLSYYQLAFQRKPEFMGGTRTEEADKKRWNTIVDLPWTWEQVEERLKVCQRIEDEVERLEQEVRDDRRDAYFQLVKYPLQAASEMNKKFLMAQKARHGRASWDESRKAHDSIQALTRANNKRGKWEGMMDCAPRRLPVFQPVEERNETKEPDFPQPLWTRQGRECSQGKFVGVEHLGYEGGAVAIEKGKKVTFALPRMERDSLTVEVRLLPNHAVEGDKLRFQLELDGQETAPINYETYGRSEEWKENVLRNQAIRRVKLPIRKDKRNHRLVLKALDEGVVLDQIAVYE